MVSPLNEQTVPSGEDARRGGIAILDYGSQYTQLIARRLREQGVYAALYHWQTPESEIRRLTPHGLILSGGPSSVYEDGAPTLPAWVLHSDLPVLGICYGMQLLTHALGGTVGPARASEYGHALFRRHPHTDDTLFADISPVSPVWMSHGDYIEQPPAGFVSLGESDNSPYAAIGNPQRHWYGIQFHPEVRHTQEGAAILRRFALNIAGCEAQWSPENLIEQSINEIRAQVDAAGVVMGVSGGVDSLVAARLIHQAVGDRLTCIFVNTGLLRAEEPQQVVATIEEVIGARLVAVDATEQFLESLSGVTDPEAKRKRIGELFVRIFEAEAQKLPGVKFLGQGTIYPDVIESAAKDRPGAKVIKTHHNVGGLPDHMKLALLEPLRYFFKDEVRHVGLKLGLPENMIWRQPFPGPGLAIRCLGEVTFERLERLRAADLIFREILEAAGLMRATAQAYAALLPVKSVGVMGDNRTYAETIVLRAVTTDDFMTADWARLPFEVLAEASRRIVNEVSGVNRVVYDVTSKPPATIEWE